MEFLHAEEIYLFDMNFVHEVHT